MLQGNGESTSSPKVNGRPTLPESMVKIENNEDEVVVVEIKSPSRNSTYYNNSHSSSVKLVHQPLIETVAEKIKQEVRELQKQRFSYASNVSYDSDSDDDSFRETVATSIGVSDNINSSNLLEEHDIESKTNQVPEQNEFTLKSVVPRNVFPHTSAEAVLPKDSMTRMSPKNKDDIQGSNCTIRQIDRCSIDSPVPINSEQDKSVGLNFQCSPSPAILNACRSPSSLMEKTNLQFLDRPIQGSQQCQSDERAHLKIQIIDPKTNVDKHKLCKMSSEMSGNVTVKTTVGTHVSDIFKSTQTTCEIKKQPNGVPVENTDTFPKMESSQNKIVKKMQSTNSDNVIPNPNLSSVTKRMKSESGALDNTIKLLMKRQMENCIQIEQNNIPLDLCTNTNSSKVSEKRFDVISVKKSVDEALHENKRISYSNNSGARNANATISEMNSTSAKQLSSDNQISNSCLLQVPKEFSHLSKDISISVRPTNNAENSLPFQEDKSLPPFLNSDKSASVCDNSMRNQTNKSIEKGSNGLIVTRVMSNISKDVTLTASNVRSPISKLEKTTNNDIVAKPIAGASNPLEIGQSCSASGLDCSSTRVNTESLQKYISVLCSDAYGNSNTNFSTTKSKRSLAKKKSTIEKGSSKNECLTRKTSTVIIDSTDSVPTQQREKIPPPAYFSPSKLSLSSENNRSIQATAPPLVDSSPLTVTKNIVSVPNSPAKDVVTSFPLIYSGKQPSCAVSSNFNKLASCSTVSISESERTPAHSSSGNIQVVPLSGLSYPASPSQKHSIKNSECNSNKSPGRSSLTCTSKSYADRSSPYFKSLKTDISNSPSKQTGSITIEKLNNDEGDTSDISIVYQQKNQFHHVQLCIPEQNMNIHPLKDKEPSVSHIDSPANVQDFKTPQRITGKSNTKTDFAASKYTEKSPSKALVDVSEPSTNSICQQDDVNAPSTSFKNSVEKTSTESENLKLSYQISQHPNKFSVQKKLNSFEVLMGRQKTPKKSPPKRLGKNSPIKFVNKNRTSPQILKYRTSPNKNSPRKQLTFNVPDNLPAVQFTEPESQKTDYVFYAEEFVTYFQTILDSLLEDKEISGIIEKEAEVAMTFKNLVDVQAKKLYIRMLGRKFTWHRVSDIKYNDIDVKAAFNDLEASGLVTADYISEELEVLLHMLKHQELKTLCKSFRISPVTLPKPKLIESLLAYGKTQYTISGFMSNNSSSILRERLRDNLNHCVKLNEEARRSFLRLIQVFSLPHQDLDDDREVSKQLLLMHYVKNKKVEYPCYDILKTVPIFSSREEFISYEEANELFGNLTIAKESKNLDDVMKCGDEASLQLRRILSNKELSEKAVALPLFLRRYCGGTRYAYVMTSAIEVCRKKKELLPTLENMLKMLLRQKIYLPHYRGRWYEQLILIQQLHLKDFTQAAETIIEAMNDDHLNELQQHVLSNRGSLLLSRRNGINDNKLKLKLKKSIKELPIDPPCYPINAKALSTAPGYKKVYVQQDAGEVTYSSVEEFAILNYRSRGFTEGIHAEGSIIVTLFGFIFWDLIYEYPVPDVFRSCYQREPLDLHTGEFYENRKHMIDKRLEELCNWEIVDVRNHVHNILELHEGKESIINWQRFRSLNQIVTLIECISVRTLSKILERLIKKYQSVRKGFPDLLVWSPIKKECKFVEVKGPNDQLSVAQKLWLNYLISCNSECAEVCKVETTGSKMLKRRRNTVPTSDDDFE